MIFAVKLKGEPMTNREAINWIINISADIGKSEHRDLWHYEQALYEIRDMLEDVHDTNVGDTISRAAAIDDLHGKDPSQIWDTADIEVWVNALPSAQPELIRCKNCKHNQLPSTSGNANCEIYYGMTNQDGFCHMAERRA